MVGPSIAHARAYPWFAGLVLGVLAYALYVVTCYASLAPILNFLDDRFPFVFFYHLQDGEAEGPIGDPMLLATVIGIQVLLFWLLFAPVALYLKVPKSGLIALTFFNEVALLAIIPLIMRSLFG